MPDLIPFDFNGKNVPAIRDDEGNPWWRASDVCEQCGLKNVSQACERLDADEKSSITIPDALHSELKTVIVNEAGLYRLTLSSRKPEAKLFKRWVLHEVLPQIRKTGQYAPTIPKVRDPAIQMLIDMAVQLDEARTTAHEAKSLAQQALDTQQWLTIREYVFLNTLERQMPPSFQQEYGRFLTGYCQEHGIPVRKQGIADRQYPAEHAYHVGTITKTLTGWLMRRAGQPLLTLMSAREEGESLTHDPGVAYNPRRRRN